MKKTSVNFRDHQLSYLDGLAESRGQDRSSILRDIVDSVSRDRRDESRMHGQSRPLRLGRLTESARFIPAESDVIAYTYAGAMHHLEQEKMISLATQLYSQNPLAHRIIELITDFCIGSNIMWETQDDDLEDIFSEFWTHSRNAFERTQYQRVSELLLYGEQCYPVFTSPDTGLVQLGNVHPAFIKQTILDPDDYKLVIGVEFYTDGYNTKTYRTIFSEDTATFFNDKAISMRDEMDGDCFYFAINMLSLPISAEGYGERSYQMRGRSELLPLMDRLGILDDLNYLNLDRIQILLSVIYDITVSQASSTEIEKIMDEFGIPTGPAVRAHDEKMSVDVKTPKLGSTEISTLFKMVTDEIVGGAGIPSHWISGSGSANRATAMSLELPTLKKLTAKQGVVVDIFRKILDFQLYQAKLVGRVSDDVEYSIKIPAITRKDLLNIGDALTKATKNLQIAVAEGWISNVSAGEIFREIAEGYGIELPEPEVVEDIDIMMQQKGDIQDEILDPSKSKDDTSEQPHDYKALDNPEETREEKEHRDLSRQLSTETTGM